MVIDLTPNTTKSTELTEYISQWNLENIYDQVNKINDATLFCLLFKCYQYSFQKTCHVGQIKDNNLCNVLKRKHSPV